MSKTITLKAIIFLLVVLSFSMNQETPAQKKRPKTPVVEVKPVPPQISYTVSMSKPWTHLLEVEMRVAWAKMPDKTEIKMPVWTPGSYMIREYARHVQDLSVKSGSGADLGWRKVNKNTWQVDSKGTDQFVVAYKVYSNELTVRTNELNDEHAFWNNGAALMFVKDQLKTPSTVTVNPYGNWKVATGLPKVAGQTNTFRADNYDILFDSPFEVSNFTEIKFDVLGKPHRYVITGEGNFNADRLAADTTKIVEESAKIFGELPYDDYTFILNLRGGGGLEHLNSTALQANRFAFSSESRYQSFLGLVAHEYFHNFNVKRIRPDALGPFDYENENYTNLLWVAEGGTEYYSNLILVRAGLMTAKEYLRQRASGIKQLQERPGRFETSLEDASFDAWIKYYRPDENAVNNQISYYDKGEIVNMMLDVSIRTASGGARSLDDVMRHLYAEFFKKGKNYTPADFQKASETMAGKSLENFFAKYVRGKAEIDYTGIMNGVGLALAEKDVRSTSAYNGSDAADGSVTIRSIPALGVDLAQENGKLTVRLVLADSPAHAQGLNTADQIVAIDGYRAHQAFVLSYIGDKKPGDKIKLTIFRFDKLRDITVTLASGTRKDFAFEPVPQPTDLQKKLYRDYLNVDL